MGSWSALTKAPVPSDPLGLASAAVSADADAREVEPSGIDTHERGGDLPVMGAAPALAEGTAGIEPASGAERATAARSDALGLRAHGEAGRRHETPLRGEVGREVETPPQEGERELDALPPEGCRKP